MKRACVEKNELGVIDAGAPTGKDKVVDGSGEVGGEDGKALDRGEGLENAEVIEPPGGGVRSGEEVLVDFAKTTLHDE